MADKNFKVKNGIDIGDNSSTSVTRTIINTASETTLDSIPTGTVESVDYSLTLYQGNGVIGKKIFATENGVTASTQEYASVSVSRSNLTPASNIPATITLTLTGGALSLRVTVTDADVTAATAILEKTQVVA